MISVSFKNPPLRSKNKPIALTTMTSLLDNCHFQGGNGWNTDKDFLSPFFCSMLSGKNNVCLSGDLSFPSFPPTHAWCYSGYTAGRQMNRNRTGWVQMGHQLDWPWESPALLQPSLTVAWLHVHTSSIYQAIDFAVGPLVCLWLSPSSIRTSLFV